MALRVSSTGPAADPSARRTDCDPLLDVPARRQHRLGEEPGGAVHDVALPRLGDTTAGTDAVIADRSAGRAAPIRTCARQLRQVQRSSDVVTAVEGEERRRAALGPTQVDTRDRQRGRHDRRSARPDLPGAVDQAVARGGAALDTPGDDGVGVDAVVVGVVAQPRHPRGRVVVGVADRRGDALDVGGGAAVQAGPRAVLHRHRHVAAASELLGVAGHLVLVAVREPAAVHPHDDGSLRLGVAGGFVDVESQVDGVAGGVRGLAVDDVPRDVDRVEHRVEVAVVRSRGRSEAERGGRPPALPAELGDDLAARRRSAVDGVTGPRDEGGGHPQLDREPALVVGRHVRVGLVVADLGVTDLAQLELDVGPVARDEVLPADRHGGHVGEVVRGADGDGRCGAHRPVGPQVQLGAARPCRRRRAAVAGHDEAALGAGAAVDLAGGRRDDRLDLDIGGEGAVGLDEGVAVGVHAVAHGHGRRAQVEAHVAADEAGAGGGDDLAVDQAARRCQGERRRDHLGRRVERQRCERPPVARAEPVLGHGEHTAPGDPAVDRAAPGLDDGRRRVAGGDRRGAADVDVRLGGVVAAAVVLRVGGALDQQCVVRPDQVRRPDAHHVAVSELHRGRDRQRRGRGERPVGVEVEGCLRDGAAAGVLEEQRHDARVVLAAVGLLLHRTEPGRQHRAHTHGRRGPAGLVDHEVGVAPVVARLEAGLAGEALGHIGVLPGRGAGDGDGDLLGVEQRGRGRDRHRGTGRRVRRARRRHGRRRGPGRGRDGRRRRAGRGWGGGSGCRRRDGRVGNGRRRRGHRRHGGRPGFLCRARCRGTGHSHDACSQRSRGRPALPSPRRRSHRRPHPLASPARWPGLYRRRTANRRGSRR